MSQIRSPCSGRPTIRQFRRAGRKPEIQKSSEVLAAGARLLIWGKPHIPRPQLIPQLQSLGITVLDNDDDATHILLGLGLNAEKREALPALLEKGLQPLLHTQLLQFLQSQEQFYLAPNDEESAQQYAQSLRNLLRNSDPANQAIALQMMQTGGVPPKLFIDLFAIAVNRYYQNQEQLQLRFQAHKLLLQYAPPSISSASKKNSYPLSGDKIHTALWADALDRKIFTWQEVREYEQVYAKKVQVAGFWLKYIDHYPTGIEYLEQFFAQSPDANCCIDAMTNHLQHWLSAPPIKSVLLINVDKLPLLLQMPQVEKVQLNSVGIAFPVSALAQLGTLPNLQTLIVNSFAPRYLPAELFAAPKLQRIELYGAHYFNPKTTPTHFSCTLTTPIQRHYTLTALTPYSPNGA